MPVVYNYNRQVEPPGPFISVTVRSEEDAMLFVKSPALLDYGADRSVITPEIFETLQPDRVGAIYIENFLGEGSAHRLYAVNIEIHDWSFLHVPVLVGANGYVILGRDLLNQFDVRLNGIEGKFEILRGPQSLV
ncbi:MAG: hypothetical protein AAB354_00965 [candidate division KSB1 bacterium]